MSRSRKKHPGSTYVICESQKAGKVRASKRFRRIAKMRLAMGKEILPIKSIELTSRHDLGGDGKQYWPEADEKYYRK